MTRREFIAGSTSAVSAFAVAGCAGLRISPTLENDLIITGTKAALELSLVPALRERAYPGHFTVAADGRAYGEENTWCGLDCWEMAGAYLLAGETRAVLDYFDFVQAAQRKDGNIPLAIFPADPPPGARDSYLRGMKYPEDIFSFTPTVRPGQQKYSNMATRRWIGLYTHWQINANPLSVLGAVCYVLTASEIYAATKSKPWLAEKIESLNAAGNYLVSRLSSNGLMSGAGFYIESPPRNQWDGVTQCYGVFAFRQLAEMNHILGKHTGRAVWNRHADELSSRFVEVFWKKDHFVEYIHPKRGIVDAHGLSDVNWAAIGLDVASDLQVKIMRPILMNAEGFWRGNMPTQLVTKPNTYEPWEYPEPLPFSYNTPTNDVAAMGRVWYLEALACRRMGEHRRLRESVVAVCKMGQAHEWLWRERYPAGKGNTVIPSATRGYCEYPAILVRVVLGNPNIFPEAKRISRMRQS